MISSQPVQKIGGGLVRVARARTWLIPSSMPVFLLPPRQKTANAPSASLMRPCCSWPRLKSWIASNREKLRIAIKIDRSQADWLANGKDPSLLLRGLPLNLAEKLQRKPPELLSRDLEKYICLPQPRARPPAAKRYTIGAVIAGLSVLGIIATVAGILAARNARQAIVERDRENLVSFMVMTFRKARTNRPSGALEGYPSKGLRIFRRPRGDGGREKSRQENRRPDQSRHSAVRCRSITRSSAKL